MGAQPASAAIYFDEGWPTTDVSMYYSNLPAYVAEHFTDARYEWNDKTNLVLRLTDRIYTNNYVRAINNTNVPWLGSYVYSSYNNGRFIITLNLVNSGNASTEYWPGIHSTGAHELGHVWSLADNPYPARPNDSLMNHERNRMVILGPLTRDINNVNYWYYN